MVAANELDFDKRRQHQVDKCIENWKGEHFADQLLSDQKMLPIERSNLGTLPFGLSTYQYRYHLDMDGCIPKVLWSLDAGLLKSNRLKVDARPVEPPSKACFSGKFLEISQQFVWRCNVDGSEIRLSLTS